jgi:hypothetical protein
MSYGGGGSYGGSYSATLASLACARFRRSTGSCGRPKRQCSYVRAVLHDYSGQQPSGGRLFNQIEANLSAHPDLGAVYMGGRGTTFVASGTQVTNTQMGQFRFPMERWCPWW